MRRVIQSVYPVLLAASVVLAGCACEPLELPLPPDAPAPIDPFTPDAGVPPKPKPDGGVKLDAGTPTDTAYVPCDPSLKWDAADAGAGSKYLEVCVGLQKVSGVASMDGFPTPHPILLLFHSQKGDSSGEAQPDFNGRYELNVLRGRYEQLLYHPSAIFPTHDGPLPLGALDLTEDVVKDVQAQSWTLSGAATIDGAPWSSGTQQPDFSLALSGIPTQQSAATFTQNGEYQLRFLDSQSVMRLNVPREVLGSVALSNYKYGELLVLGADTTRDVALTTSKFTASVTFDGQPLGERVNGDDYRLDLFRAGDSSPSVFLYGDVSAAPFAAGRVPQGTYGVQLFLSPAVDPRYPSYVYNLQLSAAVDLTQDAVQSFDVSTIELEGGLLIDGVQVDPNPGSRWQLYAYGYGNSGRPAFVEQYDVPLDYSTFSLRAVPSKFYYLMIYLTTALHPELPTGWYMIDTAFQAETTRGLTIDIPTQQVDGQILLDGRAPSGGQFTFAGDKGSYLLDLNDPRGLFTLRLPQGTYRVRFQPDHGTNPEYARGSYEVARDVVVGPDSPVSLELALDTTVVGGPVRVNQEVLPNSLSGRPEAALLLTANDGTTFRVPVEGGQPDLRFRIPPGTYHLGFELAEQALPQTAAGNSDLGVVLTVPEGAPAIDPGPLP